MGPNLGFLIVSPPTQYDTYGWCQNESVQIMCLMTELCLDSGQSQLRVQNCTVQNEI